MRADAELNLYRDAAAAIASGSKSFALASKFFPEDLRRAAHAIYWFCRYTDDLVDEAPSRDQGVRDLEAWAAQLRAGLDGRPVEHPVLRLFLSVARDYQIPSEFPLDLIEGMRMDLNGARYATFTDLRRFCYCVASVVGLMMSRVIGTSGPADSHAIDLGIAMQLTNILRDVGEDLTLGRVYLPADELAQFGYTEADLRSHTRGPRLVSLLRFQIERARRYYDQARPGIPLLDTRGRFAVEIAASVYSEILREIEKNGYDVFTRRAIVPRRRKYRLIASSLARPAARLSIERLAFWRTLP